MAEWSKAAVSKTVNGLARSGVQIPFSPPDFFSFLCVILVLSGIVLFYFCMSICMFDFFRRPAGYDVDFLSVLKGQKSAWA